MWHEARKQERKIRGMMVDFKKRAERRREFYERIKQDPAQFLQVHGRQCKIHLDPAIAQAADSPATMMPWQGHREIMIDRFDVRAHLDIIPDCKAQAEPTVMTEEQREEERQTNYERYRTLVQNDFLGVSEDKFLHQIYLEERFGPIGKPIGTTEEEKKKLAEKKAAIGYVYEDSTPVPSTSTNQEEEEEEEDLSDIDLDITINVNDLTNEQAKEMNTYSHVYGMETTDFISYLYKDKEEQEQLKLARELEEEKAMYSGRKSRRERRALREKKLRGRRVTSPPSYAARESPTYKPFRESHSSSRSRSNSPQNAGEIKFITSFGASDDEDAAGAKKNNSGSSAAASKTSSTSKNANSTRPPSSGSSRNPQKESSSRSSGRSRGHKRSTSRSRSKSRSRSRSSDRRHRRNRSGSRRRYGSYRHSRSPRSRSRQRYRSTSRSRSRSRRRFSARSPPSRRSPHDSRRHSRSPRSPSPRHRKPPSPPRKSYYRHSLSRSKSPSSGSSSSDSEKTNRTSTGAVVRRTWPSADTQRTNATLGKPGPSAKGTSGGGMSLREKLKRRMQAALNKQYKADKKAEREKQDKVQQERWDRAEELREMALRLRQRYVESPTEREMGLQHQLCSPNGGYSNSGLHKEWEDYDPENGSRWSSRSRSRSGSRSSRSSPEPNPPGESPPRRASKRSRSRSPTPDDRRHHDMDWESRGLVDY
ncbi:CLK4-associating serine/arginine rich protein-like isoform X2 [Ornithodoros turicata]|uniref:CLK4-associating serine/arginine rich protein-like isoform X2 n=1 Tax=Ornithodoros turicata TaxID=34597 RepID=UPI003138C372